MRWPMSIPKKILDEVLALPPNGKVELVDVLLASLDVPDKEIDRLWQDEVENRIDAYQRGEIKALKIEEVLRKYK
jgi:putative addiction module component (TIGR02574 family)